MSQVYIGTKVVVAWEKNKDGQEGYAVRYEDGYTSWSPKVVFERCYRLLTRSEMDLARPFFSEPDVDVESQ